MLRWAAALSGAACGLVVLVAGALFLWLAVTVGAGVRASPAHASVCAVGMADQVPPRLRPIFSEAAAAYRLGADGPVILAALTSVESGFGRTMGPSSAGAIGWTQFLPSTWRQYGVDGDGDGEADPYSAHDAIHSAANYLRASGAPDDWRRALFAYNHAHWYVDRVLAEARRLTAVGPPTPCDAVLAPVQAGRIADGGAIVPIPGFPGEWIDRRILPDVRWIVREFRVTITDGFALHGHARDGEHPLGLAVDLVPGPGGTWSDVDRLARWAEPVPGRPRHPFRWVGYDGDTGHGRGHHLHLSWAHAPTPDRRPPAAWVDVLHGPPG